jgi:hypothetical protein
VQKLSWKNARVTIRFEVARLTQYADRGWRATFYTTGMEHSPASATGTAWQRTPWRATHRAAWDALSRAETTSRV